MRLNLKYYPATLIQLCVPLLLLWLLRFFFAFHNIHTLGDPSFSRIFHLAALGFRFDLSAWAWFNAPFILLRFLPFEFIENKKYLLISNIIFFISNALMLLIALGDIPFFQFNGSHLRWQSLSTIWAGDNVGGIILSFSKDYWWAFLSAVFIILIVAYVAFCISPSPLPWKRRPRSAAFMLRTLIFILAGVGAFLCIRGHVGPGRPLSIGDAIWGTSEAPQQNIVLNAPFCVIRTLHNDIRVEPISFFTPEKLAAIRSSVHKPVLDSLPKRKNIVIITIESGSSIWVKSLSPLKNDSTHALSPFLDSIANKSVAFPHAFTTGIRSIEGITNIYGGLPNFGDMILMTSPYFTNTFDTPANLLKKKGYAERFYFGGNHGSFNIDQTLKTFGFDEIISRQEYNNEKDFDGQWGIWDHKMGEFAARDLSSLPQPFIAGWFTLNPHGPFEVPQDWQTEGYISSDPMMKTVEYEDRALRHFFEVAKTQPWYENTIFIISGDHGCRDLKDTVYDSSFVLPHIYMIIYAPDGSISPRMIEDKSVSQLDITSTVMALTGYAEEFISMGHNLLASTHPGYALMFIHGGFQICSPEYAVRLSPDLKKIEGIYDITTDFEMKHRLNDYDRDKVRKMTEWARAFMQDYTTRLNSNQLYLQR
ncbi:MAG: sulfatase-like hydrolase/transferase [Muribaculaceae bacterium]|nr:sulfatase-like hydrolase/transferase [Muribaculaceae bacterium]